MIMKKEKTVTKNSHVHFRADEEEIVYAKMRAKKLGYKKFSEYARDAICYYEPGEK